MLNILTAYAHDRGIDIVDMELPVKKLSGLFADDLIFIKPGLLEGEYTCMLAEELGHYETSYGNLLNQKDVRKQKQELRARQWGYEQLVSFRALISAYEARISGRYELADFLGVPVDYLEEAVQRYISKYGSYLKVDNYIIYFEPLGVMKIL